MYRRILGYIRIYRVFSYMLCIYIYIRVYGYVGGT